VVQGVEQELVSLVGIARIALYHFQKTGVEQGHVRITLW
jgi:hypothetical protein